MTRLFIILIFFLQADLICPPGSWGQDLPPATEQQLENLTEVNQAEPEDDSYWQQLEQFRKNPVDLNTAEATELKDLRILTDLQIESLISYRRLLGKLINIYELQAVPAWDLNTIRKLLPFITIGSPVSVKEDFGHRMKAGEHSLLFRISQVLEKSNGFDHSTPGTKYAGSPQRIFFRYRYAYKNLLQFGITGDKDAGEQFFKGAQRNGFDFYSFHLFARKTGSLQSLAIGDFTVNMGQGLVQWQSLAFNKSADIMNIKRQSPVLQPYNSAGEFNFHRGMGITIKKNRIEATAFISIRKISANLTADTASKEDFISSFLTSGYNRTPGEIANRNNLRQTALGGTIKYSTGNWHIAVNGIHYDFSSPVNKRDEPYNLFALSGNKWRNLSADYSYTCKNTHFFGEAALDKNFHKAFINGMLVSVDPRIDLSLLHRHIDKEYQAINANAFTENASPSNENGIYAGITIRPADNWRLDAYADVYRFPWLKYGVDAPSYGRDFLLQMTCSPSKQAEIYIKYRNEAKQGNQMINLPPGETGTIVTNYLVQLPRQNWRMQLSYKINKVITFRSRLELTWYNKNSYNSEKGFLTWLDVMYNPLLKPYSFITRVQYFEADSYNSRIYTYENDVLYSFSIPVFFDKGYRYYIVFNDDITKKISLWCRWSITIYSDKTSIGSGLDEIAGNKKSEIKFQARYLF
ncbi:MAG: helix-hairpin-helix domain-containing protein [Bacteroidota bacterium]|nr:helix-hairpin-helix domain-containing protein [Bacteroidota bacterium]